MGRHRARARFVPRLDEEQRAGARPRGLCRACAQTSRGGGVGSMADYKPNEMMTIAAARALKNDDVCFVGIGMPSAAANLAHLTHAPGVTLIYESGPLATKPNVLPLSIGDGELCETALTTVSVLEMFRYWLQGGRIKVGFLGGAQIDKYANLNSTVVGPYDKPKVRLPGAGGAPEIATSCGEIFIIMAQGKRSFVDKLDFVTSIGHVSGGDSRARLGVKTKGPTKLITDLDFHHHGAGQAQLRRRTGCRHLDRSCLGRRQPCQARRKDQRPDQAHHRSRFSSSWRRASAAS